MVPRPLQKLGGNSSLVSIGPLRSIRFISSISEHFNPIQCIYLKNGKIQVWVDSTINYLSNINCNFMISFSYHNNLLKRMRI